MNRRRYESFCSRNVSDADQYTLSMRYQLIENLRALKVLFFSPHVQIVISVLVFCITFNVVVASLFLVPYILDSNAVLMRNASFVLFDFSIVM